MNVWGGGGGEGGVPIVRLCKTSGHNTDLAREVGGLLLLIYCALWDLVCS